MADLLGSGSLQYKGLLNLDSVVNTPLDTTLRSVTDGMGNASPLQLSTGEVGISRTIALGAGSSNVRLINETYTLNNSGAQTGTATGIFLNAIETALNGMTHNLMDLQVGGVSRFRVSNNGTLVLGGGNGKGQLNLVSDSLQYFLRVGSTASGNNQTLFIGDGNGAFEVQFNGVTTQYWDYLNNVTIGNRNAYNSRLNIVGKASNDIQRWYKSDGTTIAAAVDLNGGIYSTTYFSLASAAGTFSTSGLFVGSGGLNTSAILQANSTTKGFLPPRMTTTQINAIATPAEGLVVYNTTISHLCVYQSGAWVKFSHSPM